MNKTQLRRAFLLKLRNLDIKNNENVELIKFFRDKNTNGYVMSFSSLPTEIPLISLNRFLASQNRLILPKVNKQHLDIYLVNDLSTLIKSRYGILEPDPKKHKLINPNELSFVLVPAIAFDNNNNRLGHGMGYYDKFLPQVPTHVPKIGIGLKEQLSIEPLPTDEHDFTLDDVWLY